MSDSPKNTTVYASPVMRKLAQILADLPPSLRKVADFILRHPLKAATLTIEEMAAETATSPAAVNRLAKVLDVGGYSGMKAELVATLQQMVSPVDKLRNELAQRPGGAFGLHEQIQSATSNLDTAGSNNHPDTFEAVVTCLIQARKIYILGFGNSVYLAGLAASTLMPFCADATAISMEGGNENAAYRLAAITQDDVLLAISLPRYSLDTLQLSRFAHERGATVLAITDSPASPLTHIARHVLFAPADHPVLTSSYIAVLALIEGLVAGVMARNKEAVKLATELTESVMSYLHIPGSSKPGKP
ncbi:MULTISPECIES: MurR/RpiR family transcriptional regulator [Pseudomonas]|jgi:DNA-binding MurR/RpiR family transcriptional regulator|uniref:MurR/RpiR family transcriptional regulator n=1 Tax=Pseudomonas kielensis TaxID=2762577 RepID=A0A7X1KXQ8_9PSED|nr:MULTISPECIES: MurR/RpiR family transcriptional regulator [Pseudomonas]MBC2690159.1 MurR/RpiR family transcriptional regulator [Pseudomonas kielensis]NBB36455.1 SIS domain-containing protein [Pseudomonas sp. BC115LW]UZM14729.1 MurR/RpiR family transcriptional regulator [Pseudomonas kielensis]WKL53194.1 MurR/RpiR family transcriptional regulator [Pseudomonas kielensis]